MAYQHAGTPTNPFDSAAGPSNRHSVPRSPASLPGSSSSPPKFDIIQWYPHYQSCLQYFLEVAQHTYPCQALAAFINIRLPYQRPEAPSPPPPTQPPLPANAYGWVSLHPYIRRLVVTGFDADSILYGWFGENWSGGIGPLHEQERRNYLFAAKSGGWAAVKRDYDGVKDEAVPYLKPLGEVEDGEIESAEGTWSRWLLMEDWMLGSRAPGPEDEGDMMSH